MQVSLGLAGSEGPGFGDRLEGLGVGTCMSVHICVCGGGQGCVQEIAVRVGAGVCEHWGNLSGLLIYWRQGKLGGHA